MASLDEATEVGELRLDGLALAAQVAQLVDRPRLEAVEVVVREDPIQFGVHRYLLGLRPADVADCTAVASPGGQTARAR